MLYCGGKNGGGTGGGAPGPLDGAGGKPPGGMGGGPIGCPGPNGFEGNGISSVASAGVLPGVGSLNPVLVTCGGAGAGWSSGPNGWAFSATMGRNGSDDGPPPLLSAAFTALRASFRLFSLSAGADAGAGGLPAADGCCTCELCTAASISSSVSPGI